MVTNFVPFESDFFTIFKIKIKIFIYIHIYIKTTMRMSACWRWILKGIERDEMLCDLGPLKRVFVSLVHAPRSPNRPLAGLKQCTPKSRSESLSDKWLGGRVQ